MVQPNDDEGIEITVKLIRPVRKPDFTTPEDNDHYCTDFYVDEGIMFIHTPKNIASSKANDVMNILAKCPVSDNLIMLDPNWDNNWEYVSKVANDTYKKWLTERALGLV